MRKSLSAPQLISLLFLVDLSEISADFKKEQINYNWLELEDWSSCSMSCGLGSQQKLIKCMKRVTDAETIVSDDFCNLLIKPKEKIKQCNIKNCENKYYWRPFKWSECSQTCGNTGRRTRDIDCTYDDGNGNMVSNNEHFCDSALRPPTSSPCNLIDCPPVFVTGNWERCIKSDGCLPGKQRRSLDCVSLLKTGKGNYMPKSACYRKYLPPPSWRKCHDYINTKECLQSNEKLPEIEIKNNTLVQMRKMKKVKIQIGQTAIVLLYSKIIIRCPVNYFVKRNLVWMHNLKLYKYKSELKERINVDQRGRLRIRKFQPEDQGQWTCIAGSTNASTTITYQNPSIGFHDWILRAALWNKEMLNEDPEAGIVRQDVVQWIRGAWSACSVSCEGKGTQSRNVHCENIDTRHYNILNGEVCEKRGQKKPNEIRSCLRTSHCPKWLLSDNDINTCTDKCLHIGVAELKGKLSCIYQEKEIDQGFCEKTKMPDIECSNENCQVTWKKSKWSKCSLSCGGRGIMARYLMCVWRNTSQPAGSICKEVKLSIPRVIKACIAPECNLRCVDLSPNCQRQERFCRLSIYRYTCCTTCTRAQSKFKIQFEIFKKDNESLSNANMTANLSTQNKTNNTTNKASSRIIH